MNIKTISILLILFTLGYCTDKKALSNNDTQSTETKEATLSDSSATANPVQELKVVGDEVLVPDFKVKINLDKEVFDALKNKKESIIADYYFYGNPDKNKENDPDVKKAMDLYGLKLLGGKQEITDIQKPEVVFEFKNLKLPKKLYEALSDKDVHLNINFYSGRKAYENNILEINAFDSSFQDVVNKNYELTYNCQLLKL